MKQIKIDFEKWWDEQVGNSTNWTTLESLAARDAWMEAAKRYFEDKRIEVLEKKVQELDSLVTEIIDNQLKASFKKLEKIYNKNPMQDKPTRGQLEDIPENEMWRYEVDGECWYCFGNPFEDSRFICFDTNDFFELDCFLSSSSEVTSARPATKEERQEVYKKERLMMPLHDFSDAWEGMGVYSIQQDKGVITKIQEDSDYPVVIGFGRPGKVTITVDGKYWDTDINPIFATRPIKIVEQ